MNIDFFITTLGGGGAERVVCNLSSYMVKKGNTVTITVLRGDQKQYTVDSSVNINYLQPSYYREEKHGLLSRINELRHVLDYFMKLESTSLLVSFLELPCAYSLLFRKRYKSKLIICERNNPPFYPNSYQWVFKHFAKRAEACVCQTSVIASWYEHYMGKNATLIVIPNAVNPSLLEEKPCKCDEKTIVTIGRLSQQKNQELLIRSFAEIKDTFPEYKLLIFGEGPLRSYLEALVNDLGLVGRVLLPGFKTDIIEVLNKTGVFVLTSDHEGMPNVLEEALVMGIPCISTDCGGGGARQLIDNGINGLLIPINDKPSLLEAMKKLIEDREYALNLGSNAVKLRTVLNPPAIHAVWESLFKELSLS